MNTSERAGAAAPAAPRGSFAPPDAGVIARLANEFFRALPGEVVPPSGPAAPAVPGALLSPDLSSTAAAGAGAPLPASSATPFPSSPFGNTTFGAPSASGADRFLPSSSGRAPAGGLQAPVLQPATLPAPTTTRAGNAPTASSADALPGLPGLTTPAVINETARAGLPSLVPASSQPSASSQAITEPAAVAGTAALPYGFLADIRPIFALPATTSSKGGTAGASPTAGKLPYETDLSSVESFLPGVATPSFASPLPSEVTAPQLPGYGSAPVFGGEPALAEGDPDAAFGFLEGLNGIDGSVDPLVASSVANSSGGARPAPAAGGITVADPHTREIASRAVAPPGVSVHAGGFDVQGVRRDFPILQERVHGRQLIWLDNAATTQKPRAVIDRLSHFYAHENSNIHRAAHTLAARATDAYEGGREAVRRFLNAPAARDIVFVRGATEGINLIAAGAGRRGVRGGDEILITHLEHHANIVPWQMLASAAGARIRVAPVDDSGQVIVEEFDRLLSARTRIVSIAHVSNALGTIVPVAELVAAARRVGALTVVDGAQAVSHMPVDVQAIGCDFYVFSGHKVFAPTGIGAVFGRSDVWENTPPWQGGGNMIADVTFERTVYQPPPFRFEAGTGSIADAAGLGAALDHVMRIGMHHIARWEHELLVHATEGLRRIPGLRLIGTAREKAGVLSFVLDGFRTEEVGAALDREGIAVRSGHHCAQPILRRFGVESTVRPSFALYNTHEEVDALVRAVRNLRDGRHPGVA